MIHPKNLKLWHSLLKRGKNIPSIITRYMIKDRVLRAAKVGIVRDRDWMGYIRYDLYIYRFNSNYFIIMNKYNPV